MGPARSSATADPDAASNARLAVLFEIVREQSGSPTADEALGKVLDVALSALVDRSQPGFVFGVTRALRSMGLDEAALWLLDSALKLCPNGLCGDDGPVNAQLLNAKGEAHRSLHDLDLADEAFTRALGILDEDETGNAPARSSVLNNLGLVRLALADTDAARALLIESLELAVATGADALDRAVTLDNLGTLEARSAGPVNLGDGYVDAIADHQLRQAQHYFTEAARLFEKELPRGAEDYVISLINAIEVAERRDELDHRIALAQRAYELAVDANVAPSTMWSAVAAMGAALVDSGQAADAVDFMSAWLEKLQPIGAAGHHVAYGLATLLRAAGIASNTAATDAVARMLADYDQVLLEQLAESGSEAETRHRFGAMRARAELVVGHGLPATASGVTPDYAYAVVVNRKGVVAERQGSAWLRARGSEGIPRQLLDEVRALRAEVSRLDLDGSQEPSIQAARERRNDAQRRLNAVEARLYRATRSAMRSITVEELQAQLGPDTMVVDITTVERPGGARHYLAFMVRATGNVLFRDLGAVVDCDDRLRALAELLATRPAADSQPATRAERIRALIPAVFAAGDDVPETVLVAPTSLWGLVPFGLVPDGDGVPLVERHTVAMLPSARSLVPSEHNRIEAATVRPALVLGDPDFDLDFDREISFFLSNRYDRLPASGTEAERVGTALGVSPALGRDATRAAVIGVERPRVLHVATHGRFLRAINSVLEAGEPRESLLRNVGGVEVEERSDELGFTAWPPRKNASRPSGTGPGLPGSMRSVRPSRRRGRSCCWQASTHGSPESPPIRRQASAWCPRPSSHWWTSPAPSSSYCPPARPASAPSTQQTARCSGYRERQLPPGRSAAYRRCGRSTTRQQQI